MCNKCLENRGITLVALIITIIVLLILAGVSLSFVFNGGILDKTQQAVNEYQNASEKEKDLLEQIDKYIENKLPKIPEVDENGLAKENTTIVAKDDPNIQIVIPQGFAPVILQTGRTDSMPGENGTVKEIMPKEKWYNITKEDINKGIVVVDYTITYTGDVPDFNEYVWIPIVDNGKFARVAWNGLYHDYDSYINGTHPLAEESTLNKYWEDKESEYTNMASSVSLNKGFYISRYEASQKDSTTAQSKRSQIPWTNITNLDAITASSNMNSNINSHLIYGIEWDSMLQWILDNGSTISSSTKGETKSITENDIHTDSSSWGNYLTSVGDAAINSAGNSAKVSGTSEYWKVNNIYDLAGNVHEWTNEKYSKLTNEQYTTYSVYRGGYYYGRGSGAPAAYRDYRVEMFSDPNVRF